MTQKGMYAFRASNNFGVKIKDPIGFWPWGTFGASTKTGAMTQFLVIGWNDGSISSLEARNQMAGRFHGPLIDEICRRAAAAGAPPPPV